MVTGSDVMSMLCNNVEYAIYGDDYETINWFDKLAAITKEQFEAGFAQYPAWKAEQDAKVEANKAALLAKLGITADEAKLLLS
jgi:hypothetical protein